MSSRLKDEDPMRTMDRTKHRMMESRKPESERDSGFSDTSSEHLSVLDQTEADVACSHSVRPVMGGVFPRLSPMIIMNNVMLKQPGEGSVKPWPVEVLPRPQVVFLQPVVPQRTSKSVQNKSSKRRRHRKYLPFLKSYPRIAPHPGEISNGSSSSSSQSSKSSSSSHSPRNIAPNPPPSPQSVPQHSPETLEGASEPPAIEASARDAEKPVESTRDSKLKRFSNTYNILSRSGLLDITLRTKELIRSSRHTQSQIDNLREHTLLFLDAVRSGDTSALERLKELMMEDEKRMNSGS
ncbi:hypothetical protein DNTS_009820 [Danionella cerebrum]|uniref:CLOCK-interacting pacemaker n=1 Tax=Danionella cerebrum TaxID=2873325 RepID=A0A553MXS5_9TELE|nr:hypothetical protein DNTS_009820 [Danionella translucida]TRY57935.1 hypothetical protein DNTS_009820 [Danionella translucida]